MSAKRKKGKRKGKVPAHLRKYLFKKGRKHKHGKKRRKTRRKSNHHTKGTVMAKRKKRKHGGKRRGGGGARRRSHRRHHHDSGSIGGVSLPVVIAGGAIGWVEHQMKTDASFIVNKVPTPLAPLGRLGNLVGLAWLVNKFAGKHLPPIVRKGLSYGVKAGAPIVAYQLARKQLSGQPFKEGTEVFTIAGPGDGLRYDDEPEHMLGDDDIGALEEEVGRHAHIDVEWDEVDAPHPDDVPVHRDHPLPGADQG